jgi:hypothetical protein
LIGVDTNILVRYLAQDDPTQTRRVDALLSEASNENEKVSSMTLCCAKWSGPDTRYLRSPVISALDELLETALSSSKTVVCFAVRSTPPQGHRRFRRLPHRPAQRPGRVRAHRDIRPRFAAIRRSCSDCPATGNRQLATIESRPRPALCIGRACLNDGKRKKPVPRSPIRPARRMDRPAPADDLIRRFEATEREFRKARSAVFHVYIGQEAVAPASSAR